MEGASLDIMSTYVISDIHGCFDEFQKILKIIDLSDGDELYLAGDYIDRGLQSAEMLKWLETCPENVHPIKGNHDDEFAAYIRLMKQVDEFAELLTEPDSNEDACILLDTVKYTIKRKSMESLVYFDYYGTITDLLEKHGVTFRELCKWSEILERLPYFYRFSISGRDCIVVHAGFCEDALLQKDKYASKEEFYLYAREEAMKTGGIENGMIIAGHNPTIKKGTFYTDGEVFEFYDQKRDCLFYDIDCGCAYYQVNPSGTLACIRLEDEEIFYL